MPIIKTSSVEALVEDFKQAIEDNAPMLLVMVNRTPNGHAYRFQMEQEKALINALTDTALILNKPAEALEFIHRAKQILELSEKYIEHELERRSKNN